MQQLFETLASVLGDGAVATIAVAKTPDGLFSVSLSVNNTRVQDPAKAQIAPFVVTGTPQELDTELPSLITEPLTRSAGLQTNMEAFEASVKAAEAKSKAATEQKAAEAREKKKRKEAYDKAISKAETLEADGKDAEAEAAYKAAAALGDGPDKARAEKKAVTLKLKREQPSLGFFDTPDEEETDTENEDEE